MPTIVARGQITLTKQIGSYTHIKYSEDGKTFSGERPYILTPLPKGYTPCKYLLSNGGYIDTGVMADAPVKMWGVFAGPSAGDYSILAARKGNTRLYLAHVYGGKYQYGYGNLLPIRYNDGGDTAIITRLRADEQFGQCDTTIVQAADTANISLNLSLYLFACNYNGTAAFIAPAETRLTSCKIYSAGFAAQGEIFISMARDFVPCLNSDGVAGLYDLVEGKFYTSANDKAFTAVPIDKGDKELIYDSYALNLLDNVESKTNRSYSVATFNIPAHLRGQKLSFSAKVTGELVDGVDVVKKYGVFADVYTTKRKGGFVWPNSLKLCIPDADGYIHYDNLDTGETSVVLYVYTYHHVRIKTNDADNPLVTLSEPMLTVTPAAKPFEPPLKDMRKGTLPAAYMGVYVSENNIPSNNFADYTWTKIKGENGKDGAKGADGRNGVDGKDGTSITPKGQLTSSANLPTIAQKGDSYIIDGFLWVYTGANTDGAVRGFVNAGSIKGPAGKSSYVHIAYANSSDGVSDFTISDDVVTGDAFLYVGIYTDNKEDGSDNPMDYVWSALAAEQTRPNILYQSGFEEGRIDYWQAGQALANTKIDKSICNARNALTLIGDDGALVAQKVDDRLQPNRWYTLSFYAKVKAGIHVLATGGFIESNAAGGHFAPLPNSTDLDLLSLSPNTDYKFYSVTFKTRPTLPAGDKFLSFTLWGDGSSISMPKLEEGQTATAFMVNENDLKASTLRPCGQWSSNVTYENNRLYIDVVSHNGQYYSCKKTNVGQTPSVNSPFWGISNKMKFVATDLLLAESAFIDNLGVRRIATRANGPRFIAEAGKWAIFGNHEKPSIESWVDGNGNAHLRFYDADGNPTYDLGPEGARNMMASSGFDIIGMSNYMPVNWSDEQVKEKLISYAANGLDKVKYTNYYQYRSGNNPLTKQYDGKIFTNSNNELSLSNTPLCEDGRYIMIGTATESEPQFKGEGGVIYPWALVMGSAKVVNIKNGLIKSDKYIRWSRKVYNDRNMNQ